MEGYDLEAALESLLSSAIMRQSSGAYLGLLEYRSLLDAISPAVEAAAIIPQGGDKSFFNLSLCIDKSGTLSTFSDSRSLEAYLKQTFRGNEVEIHSASARLVFLPGVASISGRSVDTIRTLQEFIFKNSLHQANITSDRIAAAVRAAKDLAIQQTERENSGGPILLEALLMGLSSIDPDLANIDIIFGGAKLKKFRSHFQAFDDPLINSYEYRLSLISAVATGNSTIIETVQRRLLLIPLVARARESLFDNAVLAVELKGNNDSYKLRKIEQITWAYLGQYKASMRLRILEKLERALQIPMSDSGPEVTWDFIERYLVNALDAVGEQFLFATNSHSVVLRMYRAAARTLEPVLDISSGEAGRRTTKQRVIPLSDEAVSCNAFTFLNCDQKESAVYIPRLDQIPLRYQTRGLTAVRHWRQSRSELTAPIFFKQTPIGTINTESEFQDNYEGDTSLLVQVVRIMSRYLETLIEMHDSRWIGEVAQSRAAIHEARQITLAELKSPDFKPLKAANADTVKVLHALLETSLHSSTSRNHETLGELINSEVLAVPDALRTEKREVWTAIDDIGGLSMSTNSHIAYVVREQIRNYFQSRRRDNRLSIRFHRARSKSEVKGFLYIESVIHSGASQGRHQYFGLTPLHFDGRSHYGMYLAGVLSRSTGGWMHVESGRSGSSGVSDVVIRLPIYGES